ncbi:MAG TPA: hypothetical protein VMX96_09445 [Dehalococcoidia bacterium]|nr:hypothetical protein [Dehalococcoidia bacterium]
MPIELSNSRRTFLGKAPDGRTRWALDCSIRAIQMREQGKDWVDIQPQFVPDAQGWHVEGAPYAFEVARDGARRIFTDRVDRTQQLYLPTMLFFKDLPWLVEGKRIVASAAKFDIIYQLTNTGVHFMVLLREALPSSKIALNVDSVGLDILQLLKAKSGIGIPRPRLIDANGEERFIDWSYKNGQLELGLDLTDLKLPVLLKNTTLELSVGATEDDDYVCRFDTPTWSNTGTIFNAGNSIATACGYGGSARFTGVNIPAGAIVSVAYLTLISRLDRDTTVVRSDLCCENSNNPGQIADYDDHIGRTRTTGAGCIAWDGIDAWAKGESYQSLDFAVAVQQVVDDQAGTGDALIVFWEDKDLESDIGALRSAASWDNTTYDPPAIYIEYEAGATGSGGWTGKVMGVTNPAKVMGVDVANIAKVHGVA